MGRVCAKPAQHSATMLRFLFLFLFSLCSYFVCRADYNVVVDGCVGIATHNRRDRRTDGSSSGRELPLFCCSSNHCSGTSFLVKKFGGLVGRARLCLAKS